MSFAADNLLAGDIEHVEGCLIGEFEGSIGTGEDDPDVKIADEGAEALFAFAKGFGGAALLGEVGEGNEYVRDFAGRIELGNGVEKGPDGLLGVEVAPADYTIVNGAAGGDDRGDQAFGIGEDGAILAKRLEVEVDQRFPGYLLDAKFEHVESGGIGVKDFADGAAGDDANVKIFDEGAEAFFAFSEGVGGAALLGDVADDDESAAAAIEVEKGTGKLAGAKMPGFGLERELHVTDFSVFAELRENAGTQGWFDPEIQFEGSFADDFLANVAGEAGETIVDVEVRAIGENVDGETVGAGAEGGREQVLGVGEGALGFEKFIGDVPLLAVGEDKADGGAEKSGADGEPGNGKLIVGQVAAHKEDEKGDCDGEAVGDGEIAKT
jgi:hypothetical protein